MIKSATACKAGLIEPITFWMSLLITTVAINLLASQAIAETKETIAPTVGLQETAPVGTSEKLFTTGGLDEVAQSTLDLVDSGEASPSPTAEVSEVSDLGEITSPAEELTLQQAEDDSDDPLSQVTSVSQLSDVQPTDWAFQALQSMVERYGCISGYPDGTFRGNRALTRYEFAAGLNTCLDKITQQLGKDNTNLTAKEDFATLQRLQKEFETELVSLQSRADTLEARTAALESNQFSTTTKLNAFAWFNVNGAFANGTVRREAGRRIEPGSNVPLVVDAQAPNTTGSGLVWLEFNTSFTGKDSLLLQLAFGNGNPVTNNYTSEGLQFTYGADFTNQSGGLTANDVYLRELYYQFPISNTAQLVVGPRFNFFRFFDYNVFAYYFGAGAPIFNYLTFNSGNSTLVNAINRGAGGVLLWNINKQFELHLGYMGESNEYLPNPPFGSAFDPSQGLFRGTNTTTAELTYKATDRANIRFLYSRSNIQQIFGQVGGVIGPPLLGLADDGFGGPVNNASANTFTLNFDWLISPGFGTFGRYSYGSTNIDPQTARPGGQVNIQSFQLGLAFPNLGKQGSLATLSLVMPSNILEGRRFLVSGGGNGGTQIDIEASYYLPLTNNIAILPSFFAIVNPNNFDNNPTIFVGNLRTQFSF